MALFEIIDSAFQEVENERVAPGSTTRPPLVAPEPGPPGIQAGHKPPELEGLP